MPYNDWNVYKDQISNEMSNGFPDVYENERVITISSRSSDPAVFPIALVVGLVVGGCALFCIIVMCCCCCKHTTRGRVLVPPPLLTTQATAPLLPQVLLHQTYPGMADSGPYVYPEMAPMPHASQPVATPHKVATATVPSEYPPSYDTDQLLHGDAK